MTDVAREPWTVIGIHLRDEPIVAGVVHGWRDVDGGDPADEPWADHVTAPTATEAATAALTARGHDPEAD